MRPSLTPVALVAGTEDFARRLTAAVRGTFHVPATTLVGVNLSDARRAALSLRPNLLVVELGFATTPADARWLKQLLEDLRSRFGRKFFSVVAVTDPAKLLFAGDLLFREATSLAPSGLVDTFLFTPPRGMTTLPSLEAQLLDCYTIWAELLELTADGTNPLPALWEPAWAPTLSAPESRNVWFRWLPRYARYTNENPLILGPSGSGKTRLAEALHMLSGRPGPFISITPRDFSSAELVQAELFGAVEGAYTGAVEKWGLVKRAEKGTLFIDELQSIDLDLQGKLITFIENKSYRRVGEAESHRADVRFVFATNRPLDELVAQGRLRDDFAYRLERLQLTLPPLSERRLDIAAGASFALAKVFRERSDSGIQEIGPKRSSPAIEGLSTDGYRTLLAASWPGNLRQLENSIAKLMDLTHLCGERLISVDSVHQALRGMLGSVEADGASILSRAAEQTAYQAAQGQIHSLERCWIFLASQARALALEHAGGSAEAASTLIGDSPSAMETFASVRGVHR
ncbi:MAG: sigma 54-interacting transcriptional regulator [Bdellovibrionales bacterium]|nr:sigma 54-interacting transcriptional regulator [Bdellovibrionales bacterium]